MTYSLQIQNGMLNYHMLIMFQYILLQIWRKCINIVNENCLFGKIVQCLYILHPKEIL